MEQEVLEERAAVHAVGQHGAYYVRELLNHGLIILVVGHGVSVYYVFQERFPFRMVRPHFPFRIISGLRFFFQFVFSMQIYYIESQRTKRVRNRENAVAVHIVLEKFDRVFASFAFVQLEV